MTTPKKMPATQVEPKANIYFDGRVISHTVWTSETEKLTLGLIYPGEYNFNTGALEKMEIVSGSCEVKLKGQTSWEKYSSGDQFDIPANSSFDIKVDTGIAEYICKFVD